MKLVAAIYCMMCAIGLLVMLFWFWTAFWLWLDDFDWLDLLVTYPTLVILFVEIFLSLYYQSEVRGAAAWITFIVVCAMSVISMAVAGWFSIAKYRIEGYEPNYAAFVIACVYSLGFVAATLPFVL